MSKHVTYRGISVDMDGIRRENEHIVALGNARANARGEDISLLNCRDSLFNVRLNLTVKLICPCSVGT